MKCEKTGMYTILMDGKQWCAGCRDYHELNASDDVITDQSAISEEATYSDVSRMGQEQRLSAKSKIAIENYRSFRA